MTNSVYFIGGIGLLVLYFYSLHLPSFSFSCLISQVEEHRLISVPYHSVQVFIHISICFLIFSYIEFLDFNVGEVSECQ